METQKLITLDSMVQLLSESDLSFVAKRTGVPYATLYNYKNGRSPVESISLDWGKFYQSLR